MLCPKCGNDMGVSPYCNGCNTYPFQQKEPFKWKQFFTIMGATIGVFAVIMVVILGIISFNEYKSAKEYKQRQLQEQKEHEEWLATQPSPTPKIEPLHFGITIQDFVKNYNANNSDFPYEITNAQDEFEQYGYGLIREFNVTNKQLKGGIGVNNTIVLVDENDYIIGLGMQILNRGSEWDIAFSLEHLKKVASHLPGINDRLIDESYIDFAENYGAINYGVNNIRLRINQPSNREGTIFIQKTNDDVINYYKAQATQ